MSIAVIAIASTVVVLAALGIKAWLLWRQISATPEAPPEGDDRRRRKSTAAGERER